MAIGYLSGTNAFLPTHEASGKLVVDFSRNEKNVVLNKVVKLIPCDKPIGYYLKLNPLDIARFPAGGDYRDSVWARGKISPKNTMNEQGFTFAEFRTLRRREHVSIDNESADLASWPIMSHYTANLARKAMTARAIQAYGVGFDTANYAASHTASATTQGGGFFSAGTATNPIIKIALNTCARTIMLDTAGAVEPDMLGILMNPNTAHKLGQTQEIHSYVKESMFAADMLQGKGTLNSAYNLPQKLYGYDVLVDQTVYNAYNRLNSSEAQAFVVPDNKILMFTREKTFEGSVGTGSVSTLGIFVHSENDLKVEAFSDPEEKMTNLYVGDETQAQVLADVSGFLITSVFS